MVTELNLNKKKPRKLWKLSAETKGSKDVVKKYSAISSDAQICENQSFEKLCQLLGVNKHVNPLLQIAQVIGI